jgi:hypothetical protein
MIPNFFLMYNSNDTSVKMFISLSIQYIRKYYFWVSFITIYVWYHPERSLNDSSESVKQNEIHPPIKQMQTPSVPLTRDLCLT